MNNEITMKTLNLYRRGFITFDDAIKDVEDCGYCTVEEFALLAGRKYKVVAYDTDYGFVSEWYFQDIENANEWVRKLESNYGRDCTHVIYLDDREEV